MVRRTRSSAITIAGIVWGICGCGEHSRLPVRRRLTVWLTTPIRQRETKDREITSMRNFLAPLVVTGRTAPDG